jgi:hypothetical protein
LHAQLRRLHLRRSRTFATTSRTRPAR